MPSSHYPPYYIHLRQPCLDNSGAHFPHNAQQVEHNGGVMVSPIGQGEAVDGISSQILDI
jgi:hypothetical protein